MASEAAMAAMGLPATFGRQRRPPARKRRRSAVDRDGPSMPQQPEMVPPLVHGDADEGSSAGCDTNEHQRAAWLGQGDTAQQVPADAVARWVALISDTQQRSRLREVKDQFATVDSTAFKRARVATNPYECLGSGPFVCRSALKLVEMDALCGLTGNRTATTPSAIDSANNARTSSGGSAAGEAPAAGEGVAGFTFVDLCGGPGGFSEYLCTKGSGWGITLKIDDGCDWKIRRVESTIKQEPTEDTAAAQQQPQQQQEQEESSAASTDGCDGGVHQFTISYGADGTGNLYSVGNIRHFAAQVATSVPEGVGVVVADGGFKDARDSHDQEVRTLLRARTHAVRVATVAHTSAFLITTAASIAS
jgi:hypothetical protein